MELLLGVEIDIGLAEEDDLIMEVLDSYWLDLPHLQEEVQSHRMLLHFHFQWKRQKNLVLHCFGAIPDYFEEEEELTVKDGMLSLEVVGSEKEEQEEIVDLNNAPLQCHIRSPLRRSVIDFRDRKKVEED